MKKNKNKNKIAIFMYGANNYNLHCIKTHKYIMSIIKNSGYNYDIYINVNSIISILVKNNFIVGTKININDFIKENNSYIIKNKKKFYLKGECYIYTLIIKEEGIKKLYKKNYGNNIKKIIVNTTYKPGLVHCTKYPVYLKRIFEIKNTNTYKNNNYYMIMLFRTDLFFYENYQLKNMIINSLTNKKSLFTRTGTILKRFIKNNKTNNYVEDCFRSTRMDYLTLVVPDILSENWWESIINQKLYYCVYCKKVTENKICTKDDHILKFKNSIKKKFLYPKLLYIKSNMNPLVTSNEFMLDFYLFKENNFNKFFTIKHKTNMIKFRRKMEDSILAL